jgi:hypothetical protein
MTMSPKSGAPPRRRRSSTPRATFTAQVSVPGAQLADLRARLRHTSLAMLILLVPSELALITLSVYFDDDRRSAAYRIADAWVPRLPLDLGLVSLVLMLAVMVSRFLPHGGEAAAASPVLGRTRRHPGEPRMASLFALLLATILLSIGGFAAVDAYHGFHALKGDGRTLTIGQDSHVVERKASSRGIRLTFIDSSGARIITEGGRGHVGDRYGVFPPDAERGWYIGFSGWASVVGVGALALIFSGSAGFLVWLHIHQARLRRRWLTSSRRPGRTSGGPSVAVLYGTTVAVLVVSVAAFVINGQVGGRDRFTTLGVPALAGHGLTSLVELKSYGHRVYGPTGSSLTPEPQRNVSVSPGREAEQSAHLGLSADVTRYANHSQALVAQQEYTTHAAKTGVRHRVADGTEIIVATETYETTEGPVSYQNATASAVRDRLLVTLEVRDPTRQPTSAGAAPLLMTQAPLIRDVLAANASRIDGVSFPWWG